MQPGFKTLLTLLILISLISVNSQGADFPRNDGKYFRFETDWQNNFTHNPNSINGIISQHNFSIQNIESNASIQFKRLALDNNNCYDNESWLIMVNIYQNGNLSNTIFIGDNRTNTYPIIPNTIYMIEFLIFYDKDQIQPGNYTNIIQMNLITNDNDSPHYFYSILEYKTIKDRNESEMPLYIILIGILTFLGIILVIFWNKKAKRQSKNNR